MTTIAVAFNPWQAFSRPALNGVRACLNAVARAPGGGRSSASPGNPPGFTLVDVYSRWIDDFPDLIARARCQGLILSVSANDYMAIRDRLPADLPRVNCGADLTNQGVASVIPDASKQMNLAVEHLLEGGCRSIGYVGLSASLLCATHVQYLTERLIGSGVNLSTSWLSWPRDERAEPPHPTLEFQDWLLGLPRPCGIVASTHVFAAWSVHTLLSKSIAIPSHAAVVSVLDGDTCELSHPSITALRTDGYRMGQASMQLLDALMSGVRPDRLLVRIDSIDLVQRESTPSPSVDTRTVQQALAFIRAEATRKIGSADVVRHVRGISRSKLYALFSARVGHSLAAEIRRVRLEEACRLLSATDLAITAIAKRCGFSNTRQLALLFRRTMGMTPGEYRRSQAARPGGIVSRRAQEYAGGQESTPPPPADQDAN